MFDEENLISLTIFLSFCLSVHNTYVQPWLWGYVFFAFFASERNAKTKRNGRENNFFFAKRFFLFAGNATLHWVVWLHSTTDCTYSTCCTDTDHATFRLGWGTVVNWYLSNYWDVRSFEITSTVRLMKIYQNEGILFYRNKNIFRFPQKMIFRKLE